MHGLTASGTRAESLKVELQRIRERYYGFYLVACEDLGMHPDFAEGEQVDVDACYQSALDWLQRIKDDSDLAADTRVVVPIFLDPMNGISRMWGTVGVRLAKVEARFAKPPMIRPIPQEGDEVVEWEPVKRYQLDQTTYVILVDEFVEYTQQGLQIPSRQDFRSMCDRYDTKAEIQRALNGDVGA